jgi:hypothetical protein
MTRQELEKFMLQNRLSVEEFHRKIGYSPDMIRKFLKGTKKIPDYMSLESLTKTIKGD